MTADSRSVGLVVPQIFHHRQPFTLRSGALLPELQLVYETYGELTQAKDNAVLVCHALSSDHHAAGFHSPEDARPGWWDTMIGPGKPIDTERFFVVCCNNPGGCSGSSGPKTIHPDTGHPYGLDFPIPTVQDWVAAQVLLADSLAIDRWCAVVGGSLGGMQAMQWAIDFPHRCRHALVIAAAARLSAQNIAFNEVVRQAIMTDPDFHEGQYYRHDVVPWRGLTIARMLGHITYLSESGMEDKFGRRRVPDMPSFGFDSEFQVQSYLQYQGRKFAERFDANSYLLITKVLDYFDPAMDFNGDLSAALASADTVFKVIAFTSDWRFSPARSREIVDALIRAGGTVSYKELDSEQGHDYFLLSIPDYMRAVAEFMDSTLYRLLT